MAYINITRSLEEPAENYIQANWVQSQATNFFKKHILARIGHLFLAPTSAVTSAADLTIGVVVGTASVITLGKCSSMLVVTGNHFASGRHIIANPYSNLVRAINPSAKFYKGNDRIGVGLSNYVKQKLAPSLDANLNSDNCLKRHIVSRFTIALFAITDIITKIADGIIGIIATPFSLLTLGKYEAINNLSYKGLQQIPAIVGDFFAYTIKIINPWAGTDKA